MVCPVRRPASAHGTLRRCSWRAAVRAHPPPLAQPALTHDWSVQTYRWKRAGGRSIQISEPEYHSGGLSRNSSRACCSHCAAGVAHSAPRPDCACLPARALVAQMGILLRWVCYGPEPRSASLGLPFDCIFSPHGNTVTWPSGHVPAADRPGLRNAADSPGLPDYCCRRG